MSARKGLLIPLIFLVILAGSKCDIDIGFIIESSGGSVNFDDTQNWNMVKEFVGNIMTGLPRHCTKVGLIIFSERSDLTLKLSNDPYNVRNYVLTLQSHGSSLPTNTSKALYVARTQLFNVYNGDGEDAHNVAILITHSRIENTDKTVSMAQKLHKLGVKVISVGITDNKDQDVLMAISSPPHTFWADYYKVLDFDGLSDISDLIVDNIASYKRASFRGNLDIGFIIDRSDSLSYDRNWHPLLKFIGSLIDHFPHVGTQVGAVLYSDYAGVLFSLDKYKGLCDVKKEILRTRNVGRGTNTAAGLHTAQTELFNVINGDRQDVPNVAIVITDGRMDNDPYEMISERAQALHNSGVKVICIGITNKIKEDELKEISSPPHQKDVNYFIVSDANELGSIIDVLLVPIDISQPTSSTRSTDSGKPPTSTSPAALPTSDDKTGNDGGTETNLVLYVVVPILCGLLIVAVVLIVGCVLYKRRKRATGTENEASGKNNYYENHNVSPTATMEKDTPYGGPVYDEAAKAYIYEEAAPAHIYDDAHSTVPHPRQPTEPANIYSNATGVHPPIYDLAGPSDGAYSQVTLDTAPQQQPMGKESLYTQVQRKRSYIYAQVQKKKSYIYAQVNKVKKRNTDDTSRA